MALIEITPNERDDIIQLLNYALEKKREDTPDRKFGSTWDDIKYWELRIPQLKLAIQGKVQTTGIYRSCMGEYYDNNNKKRNQ